jgi:hypothetical protein
MNLEITTDEWITASLDACKLLPPEDYPVVSDTGLNVSEIARREEWILETYTIWITSAVRPKA